MTQFAAVNDLISAIGRGEMVIMVDDADRENEGDLIVAGETATAVQLGFMLRHTSGIICVPMLGERLDELDLPMMVARNTEEFRTAFTVSVDAAQGVTTGISAHDRARTIAVLSDPTSVHADLARPGHVYPLRYEPGGVLKRAGHTEAAVDLAILAGLYPAGVLAEVMKDDGSVAKLEDLLEFGREHGILVGTIADLIAHRRAQEKIVERGVEATIPTRHGDFRAIGYRSLVDGREHLAVVRGEIGDGQDILVRVHSECLTGDVFGSQRCDCGEQIDLAMANIAAEGRGVILYIRGHEGRGIGLLNKLAAYDLQDHGLDTVDANLSLGLPVDARDYGVGSHILYDLGVRTMRLMTNNPTKRAGIAGYGLEILDQIPLQTTSTSHNKKYLDTKRTRMGHLLAAEVDDIVP